MCVLGGGGGEEETLGHLQYTLFFHWTTRVSEQSILCYIIYFEQWRFRCITFRPSRGDPRSATPWTDT
jgi:hypothetical protein